MPGRFSPIHSPLSTNAHCRIDLSQSTSRDLTLGDVFQFVQVEQINEFELGYANAAEGSIELRTAIGRRCDIPADQIVTTSGASFALYLIASELAVPGKTAIVAAPYFQQAYSTLTACGWQVKTVENSFDLDYQLNIEGICSELNGHTGVVSIASPQNPSGVSLSLNDIARLAEVMAERAPEAYLLVDETYREAAYSTEEIVPSAASLSPRIITCSSVSKAYGAPGLRTGWLTLPNDELRAAIVAAKENITISDSPIAEQITATILQNAEDILAQHQRRLVPRLGLVADWQASQRQFIDWVRPDAGALCCMRLSAKQFDENGVSAFWQMLKKRDTYVRPGTMFGSDMRHFRLGFGHVSNEILEEGLGNISSALVEVS